LYYCVEGAIAKIPKLNPYIEIAGNVIKKAVFLLNLSSKSNGPINKELILADIVKFLCTNVKTSSLHDAIIAENLRCL